MATSQIGISKRATEANRLPTGAVYKSHTIRVQALGQGPSPGNDFLNAHSLQTETGPAAPYGTNMISLLTLTLCIAASPSQGDGAPGPDQGPAFLGPFIGATDSESVNIWARAEMPGNYGLSVTRADGSGLAMEATAKTSDGLTLQWALDGLAPATEYDYALASLNGEAMAQGNNQRFKTSPKPSADASVRLMFGSCAREDDATAATWRTVAAAKPDAVVLLGDSPYIDQTDLEFQRSRYAAFAEFDPMASLLRHTPWYGTWDDHDFGSNDTDGRLKGTEASRQAFIEYHALTSYGDGERGIYTSFRNGPVEVFLIDTRSFAATEPSPFRAHSASLLGAAQWTWLQDSLKASTAPVKILACGMIWNGSVRPGKLDHWGSYPHERDALFRLLGEASIEGVLLIGGDIHRSRVIQHDTTESAGYPIHELIVSPMHTGIIETANQPHPGLIKDMGTPQTFLLLDAVQAGGELRSLRATFRDASGTDHFTLDLVERSTDPPK